MGKRTTLAFFLSLLIIIGYNYYLSKKYPTKPIDSIEQEAKEAVPRSVQLKEHTEAVSTISALKEAQEVTIETDLASIVITSSGARIKSYRLKNYPEEKTPIEVIEKQIKQVEQSLANATLESKKILERKKSKLLLLQDRMQKDPQMAELISLAALLDADFSPTLILPGNETLSATINTAIHQCAQDRLILNEESPEGVLRFIYRDRKGRAIEKIYKFHNTKYIIGLDIIFKGWEKQDLPQENFVLYCGPDVGLPQNQQGRRMQGYQGPISYFKNEQQGWVRKEKYAGRELNIPIVREHREGQIGWTGLVNKYFIHALIPSQQAQSIIVEKNEFDEHRAGIAMAWPDKGTYSFRMYMGPKKEQDLVKAGVSLEKTIDYGLFSPIARFIYIALVFFSRWTGNFGWAIVLLCVATKVVFYPLTHRSFESMQKMQQQMKSIQPEMEALRRKYKDNPQKLNKELMDFYKKKGINPLASCQSGCLPLLLQMPVFFALYVVLYNSIELRGTPFLGWIQDLSAKDPYYILPVLMGISMFIQQKLTGMGAASGAQQDQAKMMAIFMPIFLTWIFASLPSGVVLYWFTFNIATSIQQLIIRKKTKDIAVA